MFSYLLLKFTVVLFRSYVWKHEEKEMHVNTLRTEGYAKERKCGKSFKEI